MGSPDLRALWQACTLLVLLFILAGIGVIAAVFYYALFKIVASVFS